MAALLSHQQADVEKDAEKDAHSVSDDSQDGFYYTHPFMNRLKSWGVEARGMLHDFCVWGSARAYALQGFSPFRPSSEWTRSIARSSSSGYPATSISYRMFPVLAVLHFD